jgi:hypothetical protein
METTLLGDANHLPESQFSFADVLPTAMPKARAARSKT